MFEIIESERRIPMKPIDYARCLRVLIDRHSLTIPEISERTRLTEEFIKRHLRILND